MVNSKKKKNNLSLIVRLILFLYIFTIITFILYLFSPVSTIFMVDDIYVSDDNRLNLNFSVLGEKKNDIYCMFNTTGKLPNKEDSNWMLSNDGHCSIALDDNVYYAYLKADTDRITRIKATSKYGKLTNLTINKDIVYIAVGGIYDLDITYEKIGFIDDTINWNASDNSIVSINEDGIIKGVKSGKVIVSATISDKTVTSTIVVTDLITSNILKDGYNFNKRELECNGYTKEENDLIDEILESRINDVGYKTRAAAVEAARFLVLEFPYRINYFFENGRKTSNNIDGEGRYFHKGLYLDESRYYTLGKKVNGPQTWGCSLYSKQSHKETNNGLNCSGFVTWAILNAGFDIKDVGARMISSLDITDYGKVVEFSSYLIQNGAVKVGDLVHNDHSGGHIGIIIGIDNENVYVAHSLWRSASKTLTKRENNVTGVQITKYTYNEIGSVFPRVVLMDELYKQDGNLTNMW